MFFSPNVDALPLARYAADPPISFTYGGRSSAELMKTWQVTRSSKRIGGTRRQQTITYLDPATRLEVKLVSVAYSDFPTVEWTVYFRNTGSEDTPILEDIKGLDVYWRKTGADEFVLHHNKGSIVTAEDFRPLTTTLTPGSKTSFEPLGGRGTWGEWPYYNLEFDGGGAIVAIGWPGYWSADFERGTDNLIRVRAGQKITHMKLRPGEQVRTPLMVVQGYNAASRAAPGSRERDKGNWIDAQNVWRKWMVAYNIPRTKGGKLPPAQFNACSSHQFAEMINANEENQKLFVDRFAEEKLGLDYWWMDAGWYPCDGNWYKTGTWEVDKTRFPNGLRAISDRAHEKGIKTIVWFEPERVAVDTWLYDNHPEWLLLTKPGEQGLLNLGNPEALNWCINHINGLIKSEGIDLYRQDYNIDPLPYWRANDAEDRQGYTENAYTQGYLAYWDGLRKANPGMLIDSCSGGGCRNDLETMRRAVPLLRSDYIFEPIGQQGHTYGLSLWLPFFGTGIKATDPYDVRSTMCMGFTSGWDVRDTSLPYDSLRKLISQWREYAWHYYGDFYPITDHNLDNSRWIAWQYNSPKQGKGIVQAFRRAGCPEASLTVKLRGLSPKAEYAVRDIDTNEGGTFTGRELMDKGFTIDSQSSPSAKVVEYKKAK